MSKNKVAIMTWFSYRNYGTALQAFALNVAINKLGCDSVIVNYDPVPIQASNNRRQNGFVVRAFRKAKRELLGMSPYCVPEREKLFASFVDDNIHLTQEVQSVEDFKKLTDCFDAFVCGSDQVWSPRCFDAHYYLDFVDKGVRKVAYAPSFGCDEIDDDLLASRIGELLSDFSALSVREESGTHIVRKLCGSDAAIVTDPTLLLERNEWSEIVSYAAIPDSPYCLCYFLGFDRGNWEAAERVAFSRGLDIVVIPTFKKDRYKKGCIKQPVGPKEFLGLFERASCVCTDSFHGIVFSTIFEKPFYAFERFAPEDHGSQNTRVYNYLRTVGLENRLITRQAISSGCLLPSYAFDFRSASKRLCDWRNKSLTYLQDALVGDWPPLVDGGED